MEAVIHWANNITNWDREGADKRACLSCFAVKIKFPYSEFSLLTFLPSLTLFVSLVSALASLGFFLAFVCTSLSWVVAGFRERERERYRMKQQSLIYSFVARGTTMHLGWLHRIHWKLRQRCFSMSLQTSLLQQQVHLHLRRPYFQLSCWQQWLQYIIFPPLA